MNKPALNYFLGANSGQGFSSLYSEFTSPERGDFLWILKGGAGCGKSSFMKMLGEAAQRAGHSVEYVKCSGDPDSLDGVYIPTLKTAFMDGTAPHCADAGLAAVDSAYIDLGSFYDVEALTPLGESLKQLNGLCRCHYKQGYSMLSAAASLKEGWLGGLSLSDEKQAVSRRIERHCLREFGAKQKAPGIATKRFLSAYSCHGRTGLPETAELLCSRLIFLQSRCGLDSFALDLVAEKALSAGYDIWLCPDPLLPQQTEAVLIPALSLGYISGSSPLCPQLILAGASLDDVFVIVLFSTLIGMAQGSSASAISFLNIPVSVVLGILLGAAVGWLLSLFFEAVYSRRHYIRNSMKVIIVLGMSFLLMAAEGWLEGKLALSGLLAVMSMACMLQIKSTAFVSSRLSEKFGKLWLAAEVILFVLVGAAVDIRYTLEAGLGAVGMIFIGLAFRSVGVILCLLGTSLSIRERIFCVISYLPKATVQAAIGSVPLSLGLPCGKIVLSVAVLAIIITAPLGAFGMDISYKKLLSKE